MLADVVAGFLNSVTEREFDAPLVALLRSHGFSRISLLHGQYEFGKDVVAQRGDPPEQYVLQSKAGDIGLAQWGQIRGQLDIMRTTELAHPGFDPALPRRGVLVLTGRLAGGAALAAEDYAAQLRRNEETPLEVWDRERLIELMTASPEAGLAGGADAFLLELVGRIDQGRVSDRRIERFSEHWIGGVDGIEWRSILEAAVVANRLKQADRLDLACLTALALLRAVWATVHPVEPLAETTLTQRKLAQSMFATYAGDLWRRCQGGFLDPKDLIAEEDGIFVTYPVRCSRLMELLALYGLALSDVAESISEWLAAFVASQPGAAHPISDRWAVSMVPLVALLSRRHPDVLPPFLVNVTRWLGDRHDRDELGLAPVDADPESEIEYLLGGAVEHVNRDKRRSSYLATILLDVAAALEDGDLYDLVVNEVLALDIRPFVVLPRDDVNQYMVSGEGVDVPVNTAPRYAESWKEGDGWRMALHHDDDLTRYYLGRVGHLWDHLALTLVTRDRLWVAVLRALIRE